MLIMEPFGTTRRSAPNFERPFFRLLFTPHINVLVEKIAPLTMAMARRSAYVLKVLRARFCKASDVRDMFMVAAFI
jgi:hypothetical protein